MNILACAFLLLAMVLLWHIAKLGLTGVYQQRFLLLQLEARNWYIKNDIPLSSKSYFALVEILRIQSASIKNIDIMTILYIIKKAKKATTSSTNPLFEMLKTDDENLNKFLASLTDRGFMLTMEKASLSNPFLAFAIFLFAIISLPILLMRVYGSFISKYIIPEKMVPFTQKIVLASSLVASIVINAPLSLLNNSPFVNNYVKSYKCAVTYSCPYRRG